MSKIDKVDKEASKWVIKWADNWGNKKKDLPDSPLWKKHGKHIIKLIDKSNAPKGYAKKNISKKISGKSNTIIIFLVFIVIIAFLFYRYYF